MAILDLLSIYCVLLLNSLSLSPARASDWEIAKMYCHYFFQSMPTRWYMLVRCGIVAALPMLIVLVSIFFARMTLIGFFLSVFILWNTIKPQNLGLLRGQMFRVRSDNSTMLSPDILYQALDDFFGPLFWFVVTGPAGAFALAWSRHCLNWWTEKRLVPDELEKYGRVLLQMFAWVPAQCLAFTYLLMGHFSKGYPNWRKNLFQPFFDPKVLLVESGLAVLNGETGAQQVEVLVQLMERTFMAWVVVITFFSFWRLI